MNHTQKKEILHRLDEKAFRRDLIIPLLSKMGYMAPVEYHGSNERGKDIVCFEYDKLDGQRFLAIVAKVGDLTGSASSSAGLMTVVNQVYQAFDNPYEELFNMRQVNIHEVWIMTTGRIVPGAEESVINTLRKRDLDKRIRFIHDDRLVQLVDKHFNTFWNSTAETKESVIIQRDRLIRFIEGLLRSNSVDSDTIESIKASILYSDSGPRMKTNLEGLHISSVSPYAIELAKLDPEFDDFIYSFSYGVTRDIFAEAKQHLARSFYDVEETIDHAERISKLTNPEEFVSEATSYLEREYPFYRGYGSASKFMDKIEYMREGLQDLNRFKLFLSHIDKLDWVKALSGSIVNLEAEIHRIIENCKEGDVVIHYAITEDNSIKIAYDSNDPKICFSTKSKLIDTTSSINRDESGKIQPRGILDTALHNFRLYVERLIEYNDYDWEENKLDL